MGVGRRRGGRVSPSAVALVFVAAAFMVGGCLDAGGPPSGQRWISGRTVQLLQFVAVGAGAAPTSLLVSDGATSAGSTLYLASDPGRASSSSNAPTAAAGARPLLTGFTDGESGCPYADCRVGRDSAGAVAGAADSAAAAGR